MDVLVGQTQSPPRKRLGASFTPWFNPPALALGLILSLWFLLPSPAGAGIFGPLDYWTQRHPYPSWNGAAYGANRFVLVGELGSIQSSSDGITWTSATTGTALTFNDVLFTNGKFVAVGNMGAIRVSADGASWDTANSHGLTDLASVAYGNGIYVIVGAAGTVLTSPDGTNWTKQTGVSSSLALRSVTYGNNLFVAITGAGDIIESPDGATWTSQPSQGGNPSRVTCLNNRFILVDYGMKLSADGTNWSAANYVYPVLANVTYAGGYYVGVGSGVGSGHGGAALYSQDLTNWTTAIDDPQAYALSALTCGNGTFVAGGLHGLIRTSTNHLDWPIRKQTLTWLGNLYGVKYINNEFVAGGNSAISPGGYGEDSPLLFSGPPGGNNWYRRATGFYDTIWDVAYGQGRYVLVSSFGVHVSTNGVDWTGLGSPLSGQLASVTYANNLFVLTAWNGGIATSPDGLTWTSRTSGTTRNLWGAAYGNGLWVTVGFSFGGGTSGAFVTSSDGQTWTNHSYSTANLRNVAFGGGTFVMVGDNGYLASSVNGVNWSQHLAGVTNIYGICYGDGNFVAVGANGFIGSSSDGTNWAVHNSGTTAALERVAFGGGTFVATGDGGVLLQSASTEPALAAKKVGGGIELDLIGGFDRAYILQSATDLAPAAWSPLTTLTNGQRQFIDPDSSSPRKFYSLMPP